MTLSNFNLPLQPGSLINELNNKLLREELNYDVDKLKIDSQFLVQNLNSKQFYIYEEFIFYFWSWRNWKNLSMTRNY